MSKFYRALAITVVMAMFAATIAQFALAGKKPGGGGGGGGSVPPGHIYYGRYQLVEEFGYQRWDLVGYYNMLGDGSGKTAVPNFPDLWDVEPNRNPSINDSWVFSVGGVAESQQPNGQPARALFATHEATGLQVPLIDDPTVIPRWDAIRWAHDDSFISFSAVTWTAVASEGNYTDSSGQQWLAEAAVFIAAVDWSSGAPAAGPLIHVLDAGIIFQPLDQGFLFSPQSDVAALDWSPAGDELVFDKWTLDWTTGLEYHDLFVVAFDAAGNIANVVPLGPGRSPEWSPDGGRIAFSAPNIDVGPNNFIWTITPNGSGLAQVTSTASHRDYDPKWSPDSQQIAFTRVTQSNKRGTTTWLRDVLRVPATGGTPVNLTKDLSDNAAVTAWR